MVKKYNNLKRENIVKYWKSNIGEKEINTTWDNALNCCWACGISGGRLDKAHIIPECLGGAMTESNMVLLCTHCHGQNPETIHSEYFWLWIKGRKILKERHKYKYLYFPSIDQELLLMFGEERIYNMAEEHEMTIYFGEKISEAVYVFLKKYRNQYFQRYTSSTAIMVHLYQLNLKILLEKYKINDKDTEVMEYFPHIYGMGKIKRNEYISLFSSEIPTDEENESESETESETEKETEREKETEKEKERETIVKVKKTLSILVKVE